MHAADDYIFTYYLHCFHRNIYSQGFEMRSCYAQ